MTCAEIKKTMKEHGDYASAVMNLRADSITTPIVRYKNFINSNEIVKSIMGEIIEKSVTSPDLFLRDGTSYEVDEIDNLAIFYKHLCYISQEDFNLLSHAVSHYALKYKNFNDMIQALLNFSVLPIIQFIEKNLSLLYIEQEEREKQKQPFIGHQYNIQQNGNKNTIKDSQNDNSVHKFEFNKGSFFLGVLASIISGLAVWGITELIMYLLK